VTLNLRQLILEDFGEVIDAGGTDGMFNFRCVKEDPSSQRKDVMRIGWIALSAVWLCATVAFAQQKPNATVTLKSLVEKRELSIEKTPFSGWENGIELVLHFDGKGWIQEHVGPAPKRPGRGADLLHAAFYVSAAADAPLVAFGPWLVLVRQTNRSWALQPEPER